MALSLGDPAREWLNKLINKDAQFKDIASKIGYTRSDAATVSGILETDYATSRVNVGGQLEFEKTTGIPPELLERLSSVKQCCRMGVFPQCRKAWLTVDSEFFLWNFDDGEDLAYYDGCQDAIISVCLIRPRLGVLPSTIEYLLALATPSDIIMLGVTYDFTTSQDGYYCNGLLNVLPTPLYRISTDNYITCMESTSNGRLFMGNRDGNLLEFVYKPVPNLDDTMCDVTPGLNEFCSITNHTASSLNFILPTILTSGFRPSGAIVQISVDSKRGILWTLSTNSHLAVFQYDIPGGKVATNYLCKLNILTSSDLGYRASSLFKSVDRSYFSKIISICALSDDTGPIQMMAVTASGIRIYFAESLRIAHIRLPPPVLLNASPPDTSILAQQQQPSSQLFALGDVRLVAETRGTVIFASSSPKSSVSESMAEQVNTLTLSVASPDAFPWSPCLSETMTTSLNVESPWALTVLPPDDGSTVVGPSNTFLSVSSASFNKKGIELPHESSGFPPPDSQQAVDGVASFGGQSQSQQQQQPSTPAPYPKGAPPVMLTQHLDPHYRRILVITAHGIVHLRLPSPLQRLREFLITSSTTLSSTNTSSSLESADGGFLSTFLHQFGPDESICAAIAIAASEQGKTEVVAQAEKAVIYFATEAARFWQPPVVCHGASGGPQASRGATMPGTTMGISMSVPDFGLTGSMVQQEATADTFLVLGASLFLSRVARLLWRAPMLAVADKRTIDGRTTGQRSEGAPGGLTSLFYTLISTAIAKATASTNASAAKDSPLITSRLSSNDLEWILHQLRYLKALLESCSQKTAISSTSSSFGGCRSSTVASNLSPLTRLIQDLCLLLSAFIEFVGLWQIISQHNVPAVVSHLSAEQRGDLISLPVEAFVCWMPRTAIMPFPTTSTAPDIRSALITALIEYYISGHCQTASVDTLCARLRSVCPHLFGNEDALCARAEELLIRAAALKAPGEQREALISEALDLLHSAGPSLNIAVATNKLISTVGAWGAAVGLCLSLARQRDPLDVALTCLRESRQPESEISASILLGKGVHTTAKSEMEVVEGRYEAYRVALGCLSGLLELAHLPASASRIPEPETLFDQPSGVLQSIGVNPTIEIVRHTLLAILKFIFKSDDTLAHFEVIGWLLSNGLLEQVVAMDSPHLEFYLQSRLRQSPNDVSLRRLLWRQLEARGARLEAAQVLEHLATTVTASEGLTIEDRLDYLARAIVSIKALPQPQLAEAVDYLADLQDRLDVAELQRQLCVELAATSASTAVSTNTTFSQATVEQALTELTRGPLLPASELFASYADPFELHESKLMLLHFAGEADADLVEAIWKALLHRLLLSASSSLHSPVSAQRRRLSGNRKTARGLELTISTCLNRLYVRLAVVSAGPSLNMAASATTVPHHTPVTIDYTYFPLVVIISTLERFGIQQSMPSTWVPSIFAEAKIPSCPEIAEAYNVILCRKDPFWLREGVRSRLVEVIYTFVADFIDNASRLPPRQRQLQSSLMLDHLTTHLVELHAEPKSGSGDLGGGVQGQHQQHIMLVEKLRGLRRHLDRMVSLSSH